MGRKSDPSTYRTGSPCPKCGGTHYYARHSMRTVCVTCQQRYCREWKAKRRPKDVLETGDLTKLASKVSGRLLTRVIDDYQPDYD